MITVQNHINSDMLAWLQDNHLKYRPVDIKSDKGTLTLLFNDKFCLKIYDRLGHGYGVTINVTDKYDESIYDNDKFSLHWAFDYFKVNQTASFNSRTKKQYEENLPKLMTDIKNVIARLNQMSTSEWDNMIDWIKKEAYKQFS